MIERTPISAASFFLNGAALEGGFSGQFWFDTYNRYMDALRQDSFDKWDIERTIRVPFKGGHVDVLVRLEPDGKEFSSLRFTAFPASGGPQPTEIERWYWYGNDKYDDSSKLPEAALLDSVNRW